MDQNKLSRRVKVHFASTCFFRSAVLCRATPRHCAPAELLPGGGSVSPSRGSGPGLSWENCRLRWRLPCRAVRPVTIPRLMTRPGECGWGSLGNLLGEYELVRISELQDPCCEWFRDVDSPPPGQLRRAGKPWASPTPRPAACLCTCPNRVGKPWAGGSVERGGRAGELRHPWVKSTHSGAQ